MLLAPGVADPTGVIWLMKIPVNAVDVALVLAEMVLYTGAILAGAALVAFYVRSLPAILVCLVGGFVFGNMAGDHLKNHVFFSKEPWKQDFSLVACRVLVFYTGAIATAGIVAWFPTRQQTARAGAGGAGSRADCERGGHGRVAIQPRLLFFRPGAGITRGAGSDARPPHAHAEWKGKPGCQHCLAKTAWE